MYRAELQKIPENHLIWSGPPGAGKSTFCHLVVLNSVATGRPVIFATERSPSVIVEILREKGWFTTGFLNGVFSAVKNQHEGGNMYCCRRPVLRMGNCIGGL